MAIPFAMFNLPFLFFPPPMRLSLASNVTAHSRRVLYSTIPISYSKLSIFNPVHNNFSDRKVAAAAM
ncbi:hypothetical protein CGRA01v4_10034 [Colletotrichum graminicola]|nr:hypothetical protein CGRA01v4_10034 [Colletotrichum graminicola]